MSDDRQSGRTTRQLMSASDLIAMNYMVIYVVAAHREIPYCIRICERWGLHLKTSDFATPGSFYRLDLHPQTIVVEDHFVSEITPSRLLERYWNEIKRTKASRPVQEKISYCSACSTDVPHRHGSRPTMHTFAIRYEGMAEEIDIAASEPPLALEAAKRVAYFDYMEGYDKIVPMTPGGSGGYVEIHSV